MMKSKARILIDASDVLFKTVLTHRVAPSDATLIAFKILEVLHHPVHTYHIYNRGHSQTALARQKGLFNLTPNCIVDGDF